MHEKKNVALLKCKNKKALTIINLFVKDKIILHIVGLLTFQRCDIL